MLDKLLALPEDWLQCVHVEVEHAAVGFTHTRCVSAAPSGWLCQEHDRLIDEAHKAYFTKVPARDTQKEITDSILYTEAKALRGAEREVVRLTCNGVKIQYLKQVLVQDPDDNLWGV